MNFTNVTQSSQRKHGISIHCDPVPYTAVMTTPKLGGLPDQEMKSLIEDISFQRYCDCVHSSSMTTLKNVIDKYI